MFVGFTVDKDISGNANTARIQIYNLSEGHRAAVGKELDNVMLEAGYIPPTGASNIGIIFKGQMRDVQHYREGADIITEISCGDADKALRKAVISKTFPRGTSVQTVLEELHKQFEKEGIDKGEWKGVDSLPPYQRPVSMCGSCSREMDRIGRSHGLYWSMQNEALEIIPADGALQASVHLSSSTGLIGTPTITDNGVKFDALLNPEIRPNRMVSIESQTLEMNAEGGSYRVSTATYTGDNARGDFKVSATGESLTGGKVDQGLPALTNIPIPTPRPQ
nr:hypothetical protein [Aureimonas ureilytica]